MLFDAIPINLLQVGPLKHFNSDIWIHLGQSRRITVKQIGDIRSYKPFGGRWTPDIVFIAGENGSQAADLTMIRSIVAEFPGASVVVMTDRTETLFGTILPAPGIDWICHHEPDEEDLIKILDAYVDRKVSLFTGLDFLPFGVLAVNLSLSTVVYANPEAQQMLNRQITDPLPLSKVLPIDPEHVFHNQGREECQVRIDESDKMLGLSFHPLNHLNLGFVFFKDITTDLAKRQKNELEERLIMLGKMVAVLTHEIGNPCAAIKTSLQVLQRNMENFSTAKVKSYVDRILTDVNKLDITLKEFLTFIRPASVKLESVLVRPVVEKVVDHLKQMNKKKIDIILDMDDNVEVFAEKDRLEQALINIVMNACQAIEAAARDLGIIIISAKPEGETKVKMKIIDNGIGASQAVLDQALLPFFTTKGSGTGLGLVVSSQLINMCNGTIQLLSNKDIDGCTVEIVLNHAI